MAARGPPGRVRADDGALHEGHLALLADGGAHLMFAPTAFQMYPTGFERTTKLDLPELSQILEG